jgi:peptidoglycan/xylan/chitin deacetylase (PgdA/CDA1 family)
MERQLHLLASQGWKATTFQRAVLNPPPGRVLAITFDDAFDSVRLRARPILDELGWPATMFVPTAFASQRQPLRWSGIDHWEATEDAGELTSMDWTDIGGLAEAGWEIAAHSRSHPSMPGLSDSDLRMELEQPREDCFSQLGFRPDSVAYPYGDVDDRVEREAARVGYRAGAALTHHLRITTPLRWPRVGIYHHDTHLRFRLKAATASRRLRASRLWPIQ